MDHKNNVGVQLLDSEEGSRTKRLAITLFSTLCSLFAIKERFLLGNRTSLRSWFHLLLHYIIPGHPHYLCGPQCHRGISNISISSESVSNHPQTVWIFYFTQCTGNLDNDCKESLGEKLAILYMRVSVSLLKGTQSTSKDLDSVIWYRFRNWVPGHDYCDGSNQISNWHT